MWMGGKKINGLSFFFLGGGGFTERVIPRLVSLSLSFFWGGGIFVFYIDITLLLPRPFFFFFFGCILGLYSFTFTFTFTFFLFFLLQAHLRILTILDYYINSLIFHSFPCLFFLSILYT
ncbi:hypothetical protein DFH27DRAFT_150992 [Peziza echinospora]|nr:hypothetical protein DFH27DRAFT_150992 [Peziza echinospora]